MAKSAPETVAVEGQTGRIEVDGAVIARALKMAVPHFRAEMRRGNIQGLVEQGAGEDEGRHRLRFRYRGRELRMIFENDGRLIGEELDLPPLPKNREVLTTRIRHELVRQARLGLPTTYGRLAKRISLSSPDGSGIIEKALEILMEDDVRADRPLLAALAVNTVMQGLPAPWFFRKALNLGTFAGDPRDVEAFAFHAKELRRAILFYAFDFDIEASGRAGPTGC